MLACLGCAGVIGLVLLAAIVVPSLIPPDLKSSRDGSSGSGGEAVDVTSDIGEDQVGRGEPGDEDSLTPGHTAEAPPPKPVWEFETLASQTMKPSDREQVFSWEDKVRLVLPAGSLKGSTELTLSEITGGKPPCGESLTPLGSFDLSAGETREFEKPAVIEFAYDPANIKSDYPPEKALCAAFWDDTQERWRVVPVDVDTKRNVARVVTTHLCPWEFYFLAKGFRIRETENFIIVYDPTRLVIFANAGTLPNGQPRAQQVDSEDFAGRVAANLETARTRYGEAKFRNLFWATLTEQVFSGSIHMRTWVFVNVRDWGLPRAIANLLTNTDVDMPYRSGWFGHIYLAGTYDDIDAARMDCGHELFHAVQNAYANTWSQGQRRWWVEATADYGSQVVAWQNAFNLMGGGIGYRFIESPLNTVGEPGTPTAQHEYQASHFIASAVREGANFREMCEATLDPAAPMDILPFLDRYLMQATRLSLGEHYRRFAGRLLFDPTGPIAGEDGANLFENGTSRHEEMDPGDHAVPTWPVDLERGYTGRLWGIRVAADAAVAPTRNLKVELHQDAGGNAFADVFLLRGNRRAAGTSSSGMLVNMGDSVTVAAENGDVVYVLALCTSALQDQHLGISVQEEVGVVLTVTPPKVEKEEPNKIRNFTAEARNIQKAVTRVECEWDFGDNSDAASFTSTELAGGRYRGEVSHRFVEARDYEMRVRLYERAPRARELLAEVVVPISLVEKPALTLDPVTYEGAPGGLIKFSAKAVNAPAYASYSWSFGDATDSLRTDTPSAEYTYQKAGDYAVTVKMLDADKRVVAETSGSAVIRAIVAVTTSLKLELPGYWGHLSYSIDGTKLDPPTGSDRGKVGGREYKGRLAGDTLTVTGTAVSDNESSGPDSGDYYELVVSVKVGDKTKDFSYIAPKGEKLSQSFSLSVPIDPGATTGSFYISLLEQNANYGPHGWVVSGSLER